VAATRFATEGASLKGSSSIFHGRLLFSEKRVGVLVNCLAPSHLFAACGAWRYQMNPLVPAFAVLLLTSTVATAEDITCISTTFHLIGANDKVCVSAFDDPKVSGVACHISQARTGGVKGSLGLAEDPSRFSISCRQDGPITADITKLPPDEKVFSQSTSLFFKHTHVFRTVDKTRNTLIYTAISDRVIEGSPQNALSTVPIMPWGH
jgi:CreA protein